MNPNVLMLTKHPQSTIPLFQGCAPLVQGGVVIEVNFRELNLRLLTLRVIGSALTSALLFGCATGYQPYNSLSGGYSETRLDENVYTVTFSGNGSTSPSHAEDMALLRAADLMMASGHAFFAVVSERERNSTSSFAMPTYATTTGSVNTYGGYSNFRANTTMSGGQVININKPTKTMTVFGFKERPNVTGMVYDAKFVADSIREKHKVK